MHEYIPWCVNDWSPNRYQQRLSLNQSNFRSSRSCHELDRTEWAPFLRLAVSVLTTLWMISWGFYAMLDYKILTKRQNKVLHQLFSGTKIKPQKFILRPEKSFWNFKIATVSAWSKIIFWNWYQNEAEVSDNTINLTTEMSYVSRKSASDVKTLLQKRRF